MLRLAADENLEGQIVRGLFERQPELDLVRVQDAGLAGTEDPAILEWAASESRVLLTRDVSTMTHYACERLARGEPMPGLVVVPHSVSVGRAIAEILFLIEVSFEGEWEGRILYLPRRRARALREIRERPGRAGRVGERHDRAAVHDRRMGADLRSHSELRDHLLLRRADVLDADQIRERHSPRYRCGSRLLRASRQYSRSYPGKKPPNDSGIEPDHSQTRPNVRSIRAVCPRGCSPPRLSRG
ncbi:MAG: DUF5615 family PIN-like protein [Chloroflexi bacterium]|nr:DUF5615 family PIN-like protein [Chloroflexota bacterium]